MGDLVTWDYDQSVAEMRPIVKQFGEDKIKLYGKLYEARKALSNRGSRPDWDDSQNWRGYLIEIGLAKSTAHRWLEKYDPITKTIKQLEPPKQPEPKKIEATLICM